MFSDLWYFFGYHIIFIIMASIGILRVHKKHPWRLFVIGLIIQFVLDITQTERVFASLVYLFIIAAIFARIMRFRLSTCVDKKDRR